MINSDHEENQIIIQSIFKETTRNGKYTLRIVLLALTQNLVMIATAHSFGFPKRRSNQCDRHLLEIRSLHPLHSVDILIFKKSQRWTLKLSFRSVYNRYFEFDKSCGTESLWTMWCKQVTEIKHRKLRKCFPKNSLNRTTGFDLSTYNKQWEPQKFVWKDKDLYLGSKRVIEDSSRPVPVPGLGPADNIKLSYLKSKYFGCWDQSEHWVQCESSKILDYKSNTSL